MRSHPKLRRTVIWFGFTLTGLAILALLAAAALDAGYLHDLLLKFIAAKLDRPVHVAGSLRLDILSRSPRLIAEEVSIGSPPWTPAGVALQAGKISLEFARPHVGSELIVEQLTVEHATLHLFRDLGGHANWQLRNPDRSAPQSLPVVRSLSMRDAHVLLADAQKHRQFDGTVSAYEMKDTAVKQPFRIEGKGKLNGKAVSFSAAGDSLQTASRGERYGFTFTERSGSAHLSGSGFLRQGFDLRRYEAIFEASGADLKDMYYLTGTGLIDTGSFHLSGKLVRAGNTSSFSDLMVTSGQSDVRGSVSIEGIGGELNVDGELNSQSLRLADLGWRAAGRDPPSAASETLLMPDAKPNPGVLRRGRTHIKYGARHLEAGRFTLGSVAMKVINDHGAVEVSPITAQLLGGTVNAALKIDVRKDLPAAHLSAAVSGMQLAQYTPKKGGPSPMEGPVDLHAELSGQGKSVHEVAASMEGTVSAHMSAGMMRESLAELTGIDLRGLGLLLAKNKKEVPVRCGIASFQAREGTLTAKSLLLDTDPVLIAGAGSIRMDTETLDLILRGYPKNVRFLQLRAPIAIRGTLKQPSIGIQARDSKLVLIDPGKAKDADCGALPK